MVKKILIVVLCLMLLSGIAYIYVRYQTKDIGTVTVDDSYVQDLEAQLEMESRDLRYYTKGKSNTNYLVNFLGEENFSDGYFPLTNYDKPDSKKWIEKNRAKNKARLTALISEFDKFVLEASDIHRVPRVVIYGLMGVEHDDTVSIKESAKKTDGGAFIGLMQASVVTANDTLKRGVMNKQLSKRQVDFFIQKFGKKIDSVTKSDLQDAEKNIHVATAFLSVLIRKFGLDDLHKVIFSYNRGEFRLSTDGNTSLGINEMIKNYINTTNKDGANYIIYSLGKHGSFDILYNDLGIKD